jgi:hypothetical protein
MAAHPRMTSPLTRRHRALSNRFGFGAHTATG